MAIPVQEFQIGQRVQTCGGHSFDVHVIALRDGRVEYSGPHNECRYLAIELTLAPERSFYVPSERRVMYRDGGPPTFCEFLNEHYRCETDAKLAARHAAERAAYDAQGEGE